MTTGTLLSVIWLKYFFVMYWREIPSFITFSEFSLLEQSTSTLKLEASKWFFHCFQIWKEITQQFKILAVLYFHHLIIIFRLTLQQWFLWLNWTKLIFFGEIVWFLYSVCIKKCIPTIRCEEKAFDHLHLLLACCIFPRGISQSENMTLL